MPVPVLVAVGALLSAALLIYWGSCIALFRHAFCRRACQGRDRFRPDSPALAPYGLDSLHTSVQQGGVVTGQTLSDEALERGVYGPLRVG